MRFKVEISELAQRQYENILSYISNELKNSQALASVMDDFDDTVEILATLADTFPYCQSRRLKEMGLHRITFTKHRYLFVYRVVEKGVIIEGMYHELQDYEHAI